MPINSKIFQNYNKFQTFVETGSLVGDGILSAINAGFKNIHSIELSNTYYELCKNKFKSYPNVKIWKGDSSVVLKDVIKTITEPIVFWLDGHYSCGNTALGNKYSPLMEELDIIKNHKLNNHTILIDDIRCFNKLDKNYDFDETDIRNKLLEINSLYTLELIDSTKFKNDILVARV